QQQLADASGVSRPAIARIETGEASTQVDRLWRRRIPGKYRTDRHTCW
ncbi:helix-turn-helix domain-containing protein, partial [Gordonia aichiensis]